jgi:hypothetical protein
MKLAIFGHPRSGGTMLTQMIVRHLQMEDTGEVFNPVVNNILGTDGDRLRLARLPSDLPWKSRQTHAARFEIFKQHLHQDYIIKVQSGDTRSPDIIDCIREHYPVIAIERRNVLDGFLSILIADHYNFWQWSVGTTKPCYLPFTVPRRRLYDFGEYWMRYYAFRDHLRPRAIIYYEDMLERPIQDTLEMAGVYREGNEIVEASTQKLHSLEEKMALIDNVDEVTDYITGILHQFVRIRTSYDVELEHNDL